MVWVTLLSAYACSEDASSSQLTVHISEKGSCEFAGEKVACATVASKVLAVCPDRKCSVFIDADVHSNSELVVAAFKSLTEAKFSRVSFAARTRRQ
jgi:biopolymer transport protein ExbD